MVIAPGNLTTKLLLVDDHLSEITFVDQLEESYHVLKAEGPGQALGYAKQLRDAGQSLDLMILDVKMPYGDCYDSVATQEGHLTGILLFDDIIRLHPLLKCLVFTNRDVEDVEPYFRAHANVRILKKNFLSVDEELGEIYRVLESPAWLDNARDKAKNLRSLPDNWDGDGASRIDPACVEVALELIERLCERSCIPAQLVPTFSGSVQFEYHLNQCDLEVNMLSETEASVYFLGPEGDEEFSGELSDDFVDRIGIILRRMERPV